MSGESKIRIAKDGGIPLILQAMKIHLSIAAVHQKACGVLRNLAINGVVPMSFFTGICNVVLFWKA